MCSFDSGLGYYVCPKPTTAAPLTPPPTEVVVTVVDVTSDAPVSTPRAGNDSPSTDGATTGRGTTRGRDTSTHHSTTSTRRPTTSPRSTKSTTPGPIVTLTPVASTIASSTSTSDTKRSVEQDDELDQFEGAGNLTATQGPPPQTQARVEATNGTHLSPGEGLYAKTSPALLGSAAVVTALMATVVVIVAVGYIAYRAYKKKARAAATLEGSDHVYGTVDEHTVVQTDYSTAPYVAVVCGQKSGKSYLAQSDITGLVIDGRTLIDPQLSVVDLLNRVCSVYPRSSDLEAWKSFRASALPTGAIILFDHAWQVPHWLPMSANYPPETLTMEEIGRRVRELAFVRKATFADSSDEDDPHLYYAATSLSEHGYLSPKPLPLPPSRTSTSAEAGDSYVPSVPHPSVSPTADA